MKYFKILIKNLGRYNLIEECRAVNSKIHVQVVVPTLMWKIKKIFSDHYKKKNVVIKKIIKLKNNNLSLVDNTTIKNFYLIKKSKTILNLFLILNQTSFNQHKKIINNIKHNFNTYKIIKKLKTINSYKETYKLFYTNLFIKYVSNYNVNIKNNYYQNIYIKKIIIFQILTRLNQTLIYLFRHFLLNKIFFQATHGLLSKFFGQKKKSFKRNPKLINISIKFFSKIWKLKFYQNLALIQYKYGSQLLLYSLKLIEKNFILKLKNNFFGFVFTPSNSFNLIFLKKQRRIKKRLKKKFVLLTKKYSLK
jgi:hypothetical protein